MSSEGTIDIYDFKWEVDPRGYEWVDTGRRTTCTCDPFNSFPNCGSRILIPSADPSIAFPERVTRPLIEHPALFRSFAELHPEDESGIIAFAARHGLLGAKQYNKLLSKCIHSLDIDNPYSRLKDSSPNDELSFFDLVPVSGEDATFWWLAISRMKWAVQTWDAAASGDVASLEPHVQKLSMNGPPFARYDTHPRWRSAPPAPPGFRHMGFAPAPEGRGIDVIVQTVVANFVTSNIHFFRPAIHLDDRGNWSHRFVPGTLLDAMWIQFAESIAAGTKQRQCKHCHKWFEISPDERGGTARKMFCSSNCKVRDARARQKRAEELHAKGRPVDQIAADVATDIETVKGWIARKKGK